MVGTFEDPGSRWENRVAYIPFSTAQQLYRTEGWVDQIFYSTGDMETEATIAQSGRMLSWLKDVKAVHPEDSRGVRVDNNNEEYAMYLYLEGIRRLGIGLMTLLRVPWAWQTSRHRRQRAHQGNWGAQSLGPPTAALSASWSWNRLSSCLSAAAWVDVGGWFAVGGAPMADHEYFQNPQVDHRIALFALGVLVLVGLASGLGPALRAVAIRPVEALRDE